MFFRQFLRHLKEHPDCRVLPIPMGLCNRKEVPQPEILSQYLTRKQTASRLVL